MSPSPVRPPGPADLPVVVLSGLVQRLACAYLDRSSARVAAVDDAIQDVDYPGPDPAVPGDAMRDHLAVRGAEMMLEEWREKNATAPLPDVLATARRLVDHAPPALRDPVRGAVDQIIADPARLPAAAQGRLTGNTGAHLYAALTAAAIDLMHPVLHNHARLALERQIRLSDTLARGVPAEAVAASEEDAAALLTELVPWTVEMTGDADEVTKRDLRALIQLYLLDHPVPTDEHKTEVKARIERRVEELISALPGRPARAPADRLTPEQLTARRRAESNRRQAKKRRP